MKIFIIGSISHMELILKTKEFYQKSMGGTCTVEHVHPQPNKSLETLISECFKKISEADLIVAVPKPDGTFGIGTTYEIQFAKFMNKTIVVDNNFDYIIYSKSNTKPIKPTFKFQNNVYDSRVKTLSERACKEIGNNITWLSAVEWVRRTFLELIMDIPAHVTVDVVPFFIPGEKTSDFPLTSTVRITAYGFKVVHTIRDYPIHDGSIDFVCKHLICNHDFIKKHCLEN